MKRRETYQKKKGRREDIFIPTYQEFIKGVGNSGVVKETKGITNDRKRVTIISPYSFK